MITVDTANKTSNTIKSHRIKSRAECLKQYGSDYMIQQKVKSGELYEVGKAIYSVVAQNDF